MATATPPKRPATKRTATKRTATAATPRKPATARKAPARRKTPARTPARNFSTTTAFSIGAMVVAAGAALTGYLARRQIAAWAEFPSEGHAADDLTGDHRPAPGDRAPEHFRPDPTAPVSAADREALRPA